MKLHCGKHYYDSVIIFIIYDKEITIKPPGITVSTFPYARHGRCMLSASSLRRQLEKT